LIDSLKKAFSAYTKSPFQFAWGSFLYIALFAVFLFAAIGLGLIYFLSMSVLNQTVTIESLPSLAVAGIIGLVFIFATNGLNAALAKAYRSGALKEKTSLTGFFAYGLDKSLVTFAILLMEGIIWLIFAAPAIVVYIYFLSHTLLFYIPTVIYILAVTFVVSLLFTPAWLYAALGTDLFGSFKRAFNLFKRKHIQFLGLYILFAAAWCLNFVPIIDLASIFFIYPILYTAMITMMEGTIRREEED